MSASIHLLLAVVFLYNGAVIQCQDEDKLFDCRLGAQCQNGGSCNQADGVCNCDTGYSGINCGRSQTATACTKTCSGQGVCEDTVCQCNEGYRGADCELSRMFVTCTTADMTVELAPYSDSPANWKISIPETSCPVLETSGVWSTTVSNGDCGMITDTTTLGSTRSLTLVYSSVHYETTLDLVFTAVCNQDNTAMVTVNKEITPNDLDLTQNPQLGVSGDVPTGLTVEVQDDKGNPLDVNSPHDIGTEIQIVFTLDTANSAYQFMKVLFIETNPAWPFVYDGCLTIFAKPILISFKTTDANGKKQTVFKFRLFRAYDNSALLSFKTVTAVCLTETGNCVQASPPCSDPSIHLVDVPNNQNGRRRRRAVTDGVEKSENVQADINLLISPNRVTKKTSSSYFAEQCVTTVGFIVPLLILLLLLIIAVGTSCYFFIRLQRLTAEKNTRHSRTRY